MVFSNLLSNVKGLDFSNLVLDSAMDEQQFIVESNRGQMFDGKTHDDKDIRPYYSQDPYFKTRESAERYADWKQRLTPNPRRNKDVPNLYITGTFYDSIKAVKQEDYIETISETALGRDVINSHAGIMGLNEMNLGELSQKILPVVQKKMKNELLKP